MTNPMGLAGRTVLVTGASSGIGRETAVLLSELGAKVILVGRDAGRLQQTLSMMQGTSHRVSAFELSNLDEIPAWMKTLSSEEGPIHGVIHSAGLLNVLPIRSLDATTVRKVMDVNANAAIFLVKALRQKGVVGKPASVVFMASAAGLTGAPGLTLYSATKGALISACRSMAMELAKEGIRVNCIAAGQVMTDMLREYRQNVAEEQFEKIRATHPLDIGLPRDIANAAAFLVADSSRWITGTTLVVDGGLTAH